jgi:hypothetical protein
MENKDMGLYRIGRERSKITLTWLGGYKDDFYNGLVGKDTPVEEIVTKMLWGFNIGNSADIADVVAIYTINWLDSDTGRKFISEAFEIEYPERKFIPSIMTEERRKDIHETMGILIPVDAGLPKVMHIWDGNYKDQTMEHVIYRHQNKEGISQEVYYAVNDGSPETAEIVADSLIGWLNTHIGRCFVRDAFEVDIPTGAQDGTE